jgi:hypothetical protein
MARGTGPKRNPNKITIGDGSIRDLAYWLMGGDVTVKRGKKTVSSSEAREEMSTYTQFGNRSIKDAYNPLKDYKGKYKPREESTPSMLSQDIGEGRASGVNPQNIGNRFNPNPMYSRVSNQNPELNRQTYERPKYGPPSTYRSPSRARVNIPRAYSGNQTPISTNNMVAPPSINMPDKIISRDNMNRPIYPEARAIMEEKGTFPSTNPIQQRDKTFGDDFGAGFNMGGYVQPKKKKKKKKMYGGKMKKYAKGGGIRKPKYS